MWKMAIVFYWQMKRVGSSGSVHCSSSAPLCLCCVLIESPFIHFGSQSSHSVVTLHYAQPHCSVHSEAILVPTQWRSAHGSTTPNLDLAHMCITSFYSYESYGNSYFTPGSRNCLCKTACYGLFWCKIILRITKWASQ